MNNKKMEYNNAYNKANYTGISFRISNTADQDIKEMLEAQDNIKAYICKLIRTDIKRLKARQKRIMNTGDKKQHADIDRYPYEITEDLPFNDHYIAGYAEDLENAGLLAMEYQNRNPQHGTIRILHRAYDKELNCIRAQEVTGEVF